ncbi:prepilin-type N-terminal cleavage/methylation domain-containing protein [Candidatus Aerophobetes bacterium]|nr:prepilin-type N-terminal cleavage/methylation domain-containing protein [Candidatus Aerophobetes bacterium]
MRGSKGFTIVELMVAAFIFLIVIGIFFVVYQAETTTFQESKREMEAIDKLWLSMDQIKQEVREGEEFKDPSSFPLPTIASDSNPLIISNDTAVVAFYTSGDSALYKATSTDTALTHRILASAVTISLSPSTPSPSSSCVQVELFTEWAYKGRGTGESVSSKIYLRN